MEGLLGQVCITLRCDRAGMSEQVLDFVEAPTIIDQERGKTMPKAMHTHILESRLLPGCVPRGIYLQVRFACIRVWESIGTVIP